MAGSTPLHEAPIPIRARLHLVRGHCRPAGGQGRPCRRRLPNTPLLSALAGAGMQVVTCSSRPARTTQPMTTGSASPQGCAHGRSADARSSAEPARTSPPSMPKAIPLSSTPHTGHSVAGRKPKSSTTRLPRRNTCWHMALISPQPTTRGRPRCMWQSRIRRLTSCGCSWSAAQTPPHATPRAPLRSTNYQCTEPTGTRTHLRGLSGRGGCQRQGRRGPHARSGRRVLSESAAWCCSSLAPTRSSAALKALRPAAAGREIHGACRLLIARRRPDSAEAEMVLDAQSAYAASAPASRQGRRRLPSHARSAARLLLRFPAFCIRRERERYRRSARACRGADANARRRRVHPHWAYSADAAGHLAHGPGAPAELR